MRKTSEELLQDRTLKLNKDNPAYKLFIRDRSEALMMQLNGFSYADSKLGKLLTIIPYGNTVNLLLSSAFDSEELNPNLYPSDPESIRKLSFQLSQEESPLGNYVKEAQKKFLGIDIELPLDSHNSVITRKEKEEQVKKYGADKVLADNQKKHLNQINSAIDVYFRELADKKKQDRDNEFYQQNKQNALAGLGATSYALELAGEPEAAYAAAQFQNMASNIFTAVENKSNPLIMTNAYLAAVTVFTSMTSGPKKSELQVVMKQLREMFERLQRQIAEGFSALDYKLSNMYRDMMNNFTRVLKDTRSLKSDLASLKEQLSILRHITLVRLNTYRRIDAKVRSEACIHEQGLVTDTTLTKKGFQDCVEYFALNVRIPLNVATHSGVKAAT